ncbi:nuclear transport factor 2 family protein [Glaciihabitans sp. dw_435]|uniref:nuclear transport factor 2 family protein n=1 Tax=Glaciihabitans sp. dw_435 TaxID=2720081 RepID=UPI001BD1FE0C|nr:nuclear transport factor 2 family protein [Glaciihabitans sp. dw_435]
MTDQLTTWVENYRAAWESNDPADIGALFTDDAEYYTEPFNPPWRGRDEIVATWIGKKDDPGAATFRWSPISLTDDGVGVLQAVTEYRESHRLYYNLWVVKLTTDGRATHFTEWYMMPEGQAGG